MNELNRFKIDGYNLVFKGTGDNTTRHYQHSFVTASYIQGRWQFSADQRRTDTVKSIASCFLVWEYEPI